jgi:hypothetical protein
MDNGNSPIDTPMKSSNRFFKLAIQEQENAIIAEINGNPEIRSTRNS